ncbi:uncharacterized protein FTJAE_4240 [Fusarium tjaetaba]|uniref:Uncharacterized protein n=1 Tax=Fusarium tjaetaba TaxID=1567544 RepID=A0A8H5W0N1_9HYPO|nr:uncharacterized protein FTJAE_4240 [Fusarium tjaetaba]KAF5641058.1 hypothetical protein FTJAE_4240 [Fusarium tjaetaba]
MMKQNDLSQMDLTAEYSRHFFRRGAHLDLRKILEDLPCSVRYLHLYCVSLDHSGPLKNGTVHIEIPHTSELRYIHIFTCTFLDRPDIRSFNLSTSKDLKLDVYFETLPSSLVCPAHDGQDISTSRGSPKFDTYAPKINRVSSVSLKEDLEDQFQSQLEAAQSTKETQDMLGFRIRSSLEHVTFGPLVKIADGEFADSGLLTVPDGPALFDTTRALGNLPLLLNHVFALACSHVFQGLSASDTEDKEHAERKAMAYLSYICRCTRSRPEYSALKQDASTLLQRLELPRRYPGPFSIDAVVGEYIVPLESPSKYERYLKEAITSCSNVQQSIDSLRYATDMTQELKKDNAKALDALSTLALGTVPDDQYYKAMIKSCEVVAKCKSFMLERHDNLKSTLVTFKNNIDLYKKKKKKELEMAIWMGVGEIAWAVFLALCKAAQQVDLAGLSGEAQDQSSEANSEQPEAPAPKVQKSPVKSDKAATPEKPGSKASDKAKDIGKAALSAGNKIFKAWKVYDSNMAIKHEAEKVRRQSIDESLSAAARTASEIITASSPPFDYFGLLSDLQEITVQVDEMFNVLKFKLGSDTIDGLEEYQSALKKMMIRGKTLIEAQRQMQLDMDAYLGAVAENALRSKRKADIERAAKEIASDTLPTHNHIGALNRSLVVLKRVVVLRLHQYLLRLRYLSSRYSDISVSASPEMSVDNLEAAARNLVSQIDSLSYGAHNNQTVPRIEFSMKNDEDYNIFVPEWKTSLKENSEIPFLISYKHPSGYGYYDLRIDRISAQFLKKDGQAFTNVKYDISLGPIMVDRDPDDRLHQYCADEFRIKKTDDQGDWTSASQTDSDAKILPALFTSGIIDLSHTNLRSNELSEVAEVKLVVFARGTPLKGF